MFRAPSATRSEAIVGGIFRNQNFAFAGVIGLADDAFLFQPLHQRGGAVVADLKPALDVGGRGLAVAFHDSDGLLVEIAAFGKPHAGRIEYGAVLALFGVAGGDLLEIFGVALRLQMTHDLLDFVVRDEGTVNAPDAAAAGHVEHVALAEQLLGALLAQDGAAVDFRSDLEGDAGREVRLDGAGDDVDRRTLRRQDDM